MTNGPPAWWRFAQLLTEDLDFATMHTRAVAEFAAITRGECILGAVVAAQVGRADAIIAALDLATVQHGRAA